MLEMVQLESGELEGVKLQHNQKLDQLERSQETLLQVGSKHFTFTCTVCAETGVRCEVNVRVPAAQVRVELQRVQQELQEQRGEAERQMNLLEKERAELQQKSLDLQQQTDTALQERSGLQEQCRNLEARRTHAQR